MNFWRSKFFIFEHEHRKNGQWASGTRKSSFSNLNTEKKKYNEPLEFEHRHFWAWASKTSKINLWSSNITNFELESWAPKTSKTSLWISRIVILDLSHANIENEFLELDNLHFWTGLPKISRMSFWISKICIFEPELWKLRQATLELENHKFWARATKTKKMSLLSSKIIDVNLTPRTSKMSLWYVTPRLNILDAFNFSLCCGHYTLVSQSAVPDRPKAYWIEYIIKYII